METEKQRSDGLAQSVPRDAKRALYVLQITREKLISEQSMRTLKCLLMHILRTTELKHIILELYFDQTEFSPLTDHMNLILKMLVTGYNLMEPEHSR